MEMSAVVTLSFPDIYNETLGGDARQFSQSHLVMNPRT
jgi:hypothetical protein